MPVKTQKISTKDLGLGDMVIIEPNVLFGINEANNYSITIGTVICVQGDFYRYVGFNDHSLHSILGSFSRRNTKDIIDWNLYKGVMMVGDHAYDFSYYTAINIQIMREIYLGSDIFFPEQKCSVCNTPAPHMNPNRDNLYVCIFCNMIEEINADKIG